VRAIHVQAADRVDQHVHLDLHFGDEHHHGQHHAGDAGQHAYGYNELDDVRDSVLGGRELRPWRPHAEYERGRRVDVAVFCHPDDGGQAHEHVSHGNYSAVRVYEPPEQRHGRGPLLTMAIAAIIHLVTEFVQNEFQHFVQFGPLKHAEGKQNKRARRARDVRQHFDRFLIVGGPGGQRREH